MKKVYIELTDEQKQKLWGIQDQVAFENALGKPVMALGQILFTGRDAVLVCTTIPNEQALEVIKIVAPENVGKMAGDKHALRALKKARGGS